MATELEDAKAAFDIARRQFLLKHSLSATGRAELAGVVSAGKAVQLAADRAAARKLLARPTRAGHKAEGNIPAIRFRKTS